MDKDKIDVSNDNVFLQLLMEKHNLSPKQIAGWIGRADVTIYKYLSGELTIPSVIFRAIFDHTLDPMVFNIVRGDIPCVIAPTIVLNTTIDAATLGHLVEMRRAQLKCEQYILSILADGEIDKSDIAAVANYRLAFQDSMSAQIQIYHAINSKYKKAEASNAK